MQFEKVAISQHVQNIVHEYNTMLTSEEAVMLFDVQIAEHRYSSDILRIFYVDRRPVDYHVDLVRHTGDSVFVSKHKQLYQYANGELAHTYEFPERPTVITPAHNGDGMYVALKNNQLYVVANDSARELVSVHLKPLLMAFKNVFVEGLESAVLGETFEKLVAPLTIRQGELEQIPGYTTGFGVQVRDMANEMTFEGGTGQ